MGKTSVAQSVSGLIQPLIEEESLDLVDVEFKKEGQRWILRVFIDKQDGVSVEDCKTVSHLIEDRIEVNEVIKNPYVLEVSSPGLDRPLKTEKDFLRNLEKRIQVNTFAPVDHKRTHEGHIKAFEENTLILDSNGTRIAIPLEQISKASRVIEI